MRGLTVATWPKAPPSAPTLTRRILHDVSSNREGTAENPENHSRNEGGKPYSGQPKIIRSNEHTPHGQ